MSFSILTPVPPPYAGTPLGCVCVCVMGGGSNLLCILWPLCVDLDVGPEQYFLVYEPPNPWQGSPNSGYSHSVLFWALAREDLAVFMLDRLFSGT